MFKLKSFELAIMPRRFPRTCPVCGRPHLKNLSTHLLKVHELSSEERRPYLKQAKVSSWQLHVDNPYNMTMSYMNIGKPREKRVNKVIIHHPQRDQKQRDERPRLWPQNPARNSTFAINSHFWLWVPHKAGKHILSNKFWETIVSCMKSKRVLAFCTTINGKNVTKS